MRSAFFAAILVSLVLTFADYSAAQTAPKLFEIRSAEGAAPEKLSPAAVRQSEIAFPSWPLAESESLAIPLLDGKTYIAVQKDAEFRALDDRTWRGLIREGKFEGDVILTFRKGFVSGLIYSPAAVYEILPKGDRHFLLELDQSLFPECGGQPDPGNFSDGTRAENSLASVDSGDRIDVMIVYTTATKNLLGGDAQAQAFAQQAIDATNTAYINSRINQRVRLVHAREYLFTETGSSSSDLSTLRNNAEIQALRNDHKADLVAMIGEVTDVCGIGYLVGSAGGAASGYSITARSCAVGNVTLAHEMGHNMGSHHNPENAGSAIFPYSYGHYVNGVFRTVMSYVNQCPNGCARRPYFSSPSVFYQGYPTGIENARDNVRSLNNTADNVANYRYSGANLMLADPAGGALPRNIGRTLTWTSENVGGNVRIYLSRDDGATWQTLVSDTPNDGSEAVVVSGPATKRARLRISSLADPAVSDSTTKNISIR